MKEFAILRALDKISGMFKAFGVDYPIMRKILQLKLTMDGRRSTTMYANEKNDNSKNYFRSSLMVYAFMGVFIGVFMLPSFSLYFKMNMSLGVIMFMIISTMISDFSSVLLDVKDKNILLARPVTAKTLNAAKLVHIILYLFSIATAISLGTMVVGTVKYGWMFLAIFAVILVLICGFLILLTALLYYIMLKLFSGEKLKDIINYFQIALTVFLVLIYQVMGRMFQFIDFDMVITPEPWHLLLPPAWFAAPFSMLLEGDVGAYYQALSILGLIVPLITIIIYIKVVAPRFESKLQKLGEVGIEKRHIRKERFRRCLATLLCRKPEAKSFFLFSWIMLGKERKLKLTILPNLTLAVIFPFIFLANFFGRGMAFSESLAMIAEGRYYLNLYFSVALLATLFTGIQYSENYKAAWIYRVLPLGEPGAIIKEAFKAFAVRYIVPIYLILTVVFVWIFGFRILPDIGLIFINLMLLMVGVLRFTEKKLPFSEGFSISNKGQNIATMLLCFVACLALTGLHYLALNFMPFGLIINMVISLAITAILWRSCFRAEAVRICG